MDFGHLGHTIKSGLTGAVSDLVGGLWAGTPSLTRGSPMQGPNAEFGGAAEWALLVAETAGRQPQRSLRERSTGGKFFSIHSCFGVYQEAES